MWQQRKQTVCLRVFTLWKKNFVWYILWKRYAHHEYQQQCFDRYMITWAQQISVWIFGFFFANTLNPWLEFIERKNVHDFLSIFVFSTNCEHFDQQRFYWKPFIAHVLSIIRKTRNDSNKSRNWNETQPKYSNMMYKFNIFKIVSIYDDTDIGRLAWIRNVFASILKRIDKTLAVYSIVTYLLCHNKSG